MALWAPTDGQFHYVFFYFQGIPGTVLSRLSYKIIFSLFPDLQSCSKVS